MPKINRLEVLAVIVVFMLLLPGIGSTVRAIESDISARRKTVLESIQKGEGAIPIWEEALNDENALVRRAAIRLLAALGIPAEEALKKALRNQDFVVRRTAMIALSKRLGVDATPYLATALEDQHISVRLTAVNFLITIKPRTEKIVSLLETVRDDESELVRNVVVRALWPFHTETIRIRDRLDFDFDVVVDFRIPLPRDNWRFRLDPQRYGHLKKWFDPDFDDTAWNTISIEKAWQEFDYDHIGVVWYRRWITLPEKPDHVAVEIHFQGVDESAWVWVNGEYVGEHDIGPRGWNKPFRFDVTEQVRWGRKNHITVRAMNTAYAGGIWRPVELEILK